LKFGYSYKSSDGIRHESVFVAKSKEEVFSALRAIGIKPIKVWPIYSRFHVRRSVLIISLLIIALGLSLYYTFSETVTKKNNVSITSPRHQIYGDPARMEEFESSGYKTILLLPGDRFLAAYAIPGKQISNEGLISPLKAKELLREVINEDLIIFDSDAPETKELKKILNGMKQELRAYLADGIGTIESYVMRLRERQIEEIRIYERVKQELESVTDLKIREQRNESLRAMGLKTIPRPRKK
jgi:hypothetical protein